MNIEKRIRELYQLNPKTKILVEKIHEKAKQLEKNGYDNIRIMNFCGTHEWTITHFGIRTLMPENIELIAGPGCPVCITPGHYVDILIELSFEEYTILSYGDSYKLPGTRVRGIRSLFDAKLHGGKTEVVYSFYDAVKKANENKEKKYVFFAVGFETTIPSTAIPLINGLVPENLYMLSAYRLTPPIMKYLLNNYPEAKLGGIIAPGHVSAITGANSWSFLPREYNIPTVVAGFEPLDVLIAIYHILKMLLFNKPLLINEYTRVVKPEGNIYAKEAINKAYKIVGSYWRGIGFVPLSGATHREEYSDRDILRVLGIEDKPVEDKLPGCRCSEVTLGLAKPTDCPLFLRTCTPNKPYGPCMVSSEGTCKIWTENLPVRIK
ncbi:MAG: hydrogenase formation protein HypD [Staphylothermus sp.]|nr:hydrogenase formation protein HypD [Staphylothermus sp.]